MARGRHRRTEPDFLTSIVLLLGRTMWLLVSWPIRALFGRRSAVLDQQYYREHWEIIAHDLLSEDQQHMKQAILDADKLFDHAMRAQNLPGSTFADRLRAGQRRMSAETYQMIWEGHKLRNQVAHEVGYSVTKAESEAAARSFRRGLQALGAL